MGIPGVFAGYSLGPGLHWSRKYRVWALCDWTKQNLAYDAEKPIAKLRTPHYTERIELKEPLEFPCIAEYERITVTIEGLKVKDRLDGNSEMLPPPPPDDDDDEDDDGADGGGQHSSKVPPGKSEGELEAERLLGEVPMIMGPPGIDKPAHPDLVFLEGQWPEFRSQPSGRLTCSTPELRAQFNLTNDHKRKNHHTCRDVLLPVKSCENGCGQSLDKRNEGCRGSKLQTLSAPKFGEAPNNGQ